LVAALAQLKSLQELAPLASIYLFISGAALSLALSVVAAYLRHQYQLWSLWADADPNYVSEEKRSSYSRLYFKHLNVLRWLMFISVFVLVADFTLLISALWYRYFH
jgi:non-ribosomal peptide synthetase component F